MKVTVTQMSPTPSGLRLGLRVEHEKAGWIRFAATALVISDLSREERAVLLKALNHVVDEVLDSEIDQVLF